MASPEVYSSTTTSAPKQSGCFDVPNKLLDLKRFAVKVAEVLLSLVAFILEEVVTTCISCHALYFFEFVICTAFFFTMLLLILISTKLRKKVGIGYWSQLDFVYTAVIAVLLFLASVIFASSNVRSSVEWAAVSFGFLSFIAFAADVILFYMTNGNPWKVHANVPANNTESQVTQETERLNVVSSGAE
ncbi:CKLF-like MARVEL transmembrane domain-containing protein 6 [Lampris incognitus]|uniref:CKLF-like MARVEL transmembrane domain-containing protein 6 n=1 Tax=Lampris incognitus TaxID=2546036 RepID=UPI0024B57964|nr:CKLF-like MARVEL transmembrane domain-containing protein 6 [Lampris incognitus]XP_056142635.1 CKLF-like MARVEL transmembrane domain-containing protein 6 [Lampris incognitus]